MPETIKTETMKLDDQTGLVHRGQPRYFHLLWEEDLEDLRPILTAIRDRRTEVVDYWHRLYVLHFGDSRSLSEAEFRLIFESALERNQRDLLRKDMDAYARDIHLLGEQLAEHHVSLQEIIASLHLFEEAAQSVFPEDLGHDRAWAYTTFDKLSHVRIILLTDSYVRSQSALSGARLQALEREAAQIPHDQRTRFRGIVGGSRVLRELYRRIEAAGQTRGTVLIVGESGTGKELVARAIHESGNRNAPFVALNCAALPKDLIESELFGYKRGAFSGANTEYLGLFRAAEGGTLFLDEITEMAADTQSKLLRAIQERRVRPVGATAEVAVNARLVASTNRDPEEAVRTGRLRQDLYYRLQASVLRVPPLRERLDDVPMLAAHFIDFFNEKLARPTPITALDDEALAAMKAYQWPGNVRELSNAIEGAFTFGNSSVIHCADLPPAISGRVSTSNLAPQACPVIAKYSDAEKDLIERALEMAQWNKAKAARILGISRKKLYARIGKYGME